MPSKRGMMAGGEIGDNPRMDGGIGQRIGREGILKSSLKV